MKETFLSTRRLIGDVMFTLMLHKWLALSTFFGTAIFVLFVVFISGPTYEGSVLLQIRSNPSQNLSPFADLSEKSSPVAGGNRALDVVELAKSRDIAEIVVKELGLDTRYAMRRTNPQKLRDKINLSIYKCATAPFDLLRKLGVLDAKEDDFLASAVDDFLNETEEVEVIEDTQVVKITIGEETPQLSMDGANRLADLVVSKLLEMDRRETEMAYRFAEERLPPLQEAYAAASAASDEFRVSQHIASLPDEKSLKLNLSESFRADTMKLRAQLADLSARQAEVTKRLEAQTSRLTSADVHASLVSQQNDVALQRAGIEASLASTEASQAALAQELQWLIQKEKAYTDLEQERLMAQRLYLDMKDRLEKLGMQKLSQQSEIDVRIADRAYISPVASPDWPMWIICFAIILFVGSAAAVALPLLVEYWSDRIRRPIVVAEQLDLPVLKPVPKL